MCFALRRDGDLCSERCLSCAEEPHLSSARSVIQSYGMFNHTRTFGAVPDPDGGRWCARPPASCAPSVHTEYCVLTDGVPGPGDVGVVTRWSMIVAVPRARARLGKDHFRRSASLWPRTFFWGGRFVCCTHEFLSPRWRSLVGCPRACEGLQVIRPRSVRRELLAATFPVKGRNRSMRGFRRLVGMTSPARSIELLERPSTEVECCCSGTDSAGAWRTGG